MNSFGGASELSWGNLNFYGVIILVLCSVLGLYSALVMVRVGKGTPLPLDQTQELVIKGPYRFVRNPMAVAGIG